MKVIVPKGYTRTAIILHWVMALPLIGLLLFGLQTMGGHHDRVWPTIHASVGFALLALVGVRILWRWRYPPPPLPNNMSTASRLSAQVSHLALYASMIMLPITGWLAFTEHVRRTLGVASASFFWIAKIPILPDFGINFHFIHKWGGNAVLTLIALHVLAALKHHFYDRDDVLVRMLRSRKNRHR
jgi:cytochrome b561